MLIGVIAPDRSKQWRSASTPVPPILRKSSAPFSTANARASADVEAVVRAIVADVIARGDRALQEYTQKFDRLDLDRAGIKVTAEEIAAALGDCAPPRSMR